FHVHPHRSDELKPMETKTRVFERQKLRTKRVIGIPVPVIALMLIIAGGALAALVSKTIQSPAQSVQGADIQFKTGTMPTASPVINSVILTTVQGLGKNGYTGPVKLQVVIGSNSASDTCVSLNAVITNGAGTPGFYQAVYPGPGASVVVPIVGTNAPAGFLGGCTVT